MAKRRTVLVIDDTQTIRKFLKISLENYGYIVEESGEGLRGFENFTKDKPDIVILDLGLPDIDGIELLKRIRQADKETPVIILTVRSEEESFKAALKNGANAYLTKPFQIYDLLETIEEVIS